MRELISERGRSAEPRSAVSRCPPPAASLRGDHEPIAATASERVGVRVWAATARTWKLSGAPDSLPPFISKLARSRRERPLRGPLLVGMCRPQERWWSWTRCTDEVGGDGTASVEVEFRAFLAVIFLFIYCCFLFPLCYYFFPLEKLYGPEKICDWRCCCQRERS
jgi:hypothetical protein